VYKRAKEPNEKIRPLPAAEMGFAKEKHYWQNDWLKEEEQLHGLNSNALDKAGIKPLRWH
jgi:hypothetical protein